MSQDWFHHLDKYHPQDQKDEAPGGDRPGKKEAERFPIQDEIDLHGLTADQAQGQLLSFLGESRQRGYRKVLVIHGKGLHSPRGESVLKKTLGEILKRNKGVEFWGESKREQGGKGATWVWLRP